MEVTESPWSLALLNSSAELRQMNAPPESKAAYSAIIINALLYPGIFKHREVDNCISLSARKLEDVLGRGVFLNLNTSMGWLDEHPVLDNLPYIWDGKRGGSTRAYEISPKGLAALESGVSFISEHTKRSAVPRHRGKAMRSEDSRGSRARGRFKLPLDVLINVKALHHLDQLLARSSEQHRFERTFSKEVDLESGAIAQRKKVIRARFFIHALIAYSKESDRNSPKLSQHYCQSASGRWYSRGPILNLQSAPRIVRNAAFAGYQLIDIDSCHFALLSQIASRLGASTPTIDRLLMDKDLFREELAADCNCSVEQTKRSLIALIYGARLTPISGAFCSILQPDQLTQFLDSEVVHNLHSEIQDASTSIIKEYSSRSRKPGVLVNDLNKEIKLSDKPTRKLAHILQGAESYILSVIGKKYGSRMRLLLHDGFICTASIDAREVKEFVKRQTGWSLSFSSELLK